MNSIKRQLYPDELSHRKIKKLRTCSGDSLSITCIENLSNEVLYEIFDYLDGSDIYIAFFNLNIRFQRLITCSLLPLKINVCSKTKISTEYLWQNVIIPNKDHIRSIHLKNPLFIDEFVTKDILDSTFNQLESIVVNETSNDKLLLLLIAHLPTFPHLFSLTIYLPMDCSKYLNYIYEMIFDFPLLKSNNLSLLNDNKSNLIVSPSVNGQFSTIEYLIIDHH